MKPEAKLILGFLCALALTVIFYEPNDSYTQVHDDAASRNAGLLVDTSSM